MIKEAAVFLTEGCQCTVKAENPGVDLLVPVRWDDVIEVSEPEEVDLPLVGLGGGTPIATDAASAADQKVPLAEAKPTESSTAESTSLPSAETPSIESSVADLERRTEELIGEANRVSESTEKLLAKTSSPPAPGIGLPIMVMLVLGGIAAVLGMLIMRRS
jgi:hypothetical protein